MANKTYTVNIPGGEQIKVNGPEGASKEEVIKQAKILYEAKNRPEINTVAEGARKAAQGLTFGFADEIEAGVKSAFSDETYQQARDRLREQGDEFSRQNPKTAMALELAGGLVVPGGFAAGVGKQALKQGAKKIPGLLKGPTAQGAGYGALYGAGQAEELSDVPEQSMYGAGFGGAASKLVSGVGQVVAPKLKQGAQALYDQGVKLTPGQSMGGAVNWLEQKAGAVIPGIKERRVEALADWNKVIADDVLKPLGKKLPDNLDINQAAKFAQDAAGEAYESILPNLKINTTPALKKEFNKRLNAFLKEESDGLTNASIKRLKQEASILKRAIGTKGREGAGIKMIDKNLKDRSKYYTLNPKDADEVALSDPMKRLTELMKDELVFQNPKFKPALDATDKAFQGIAQFQGAVGSGGIGGAFTPKQLAANAAKGLGKSGTRIEKATLKGPMSQRAKSVEDIFKTTNPDSGTAGNIAVASQLMPGVLGGSAYAGTQTEGLTSKALMTPAVLWGLYSKPGQQAVRKLIQSGAAAKEIRAILEKIAPAAGAISSQQNELR